MAQAQRIEVANDEVDTAGAAPGAAPGKAANDRQVRARGAQRRDRAPDMSPPTTLEPKKRRRRRRPVLLRLFGISVFGWIRLTILCVMVGFVVMAINFDPRTVEVDLASTVETLVANTVTVGTFLIQNFWRPALAGAAVVLPLWILWRLVSLPFRR
ncbi:MAG: hypothetical protein AAGJ32_13180 [Pseudomonadota bacterium]